MDGLAPVGPARGLFPRASNLVSWQEIELLRECCEVVRDARLRGRSSELGGVGRNWLPFELPDGFLAGVTGSM